MEERAEVRMNLRRRVILEELMSAACHPTAEELLALVRRRLPRVSLGTVYRNLDVLARNGLLRVVEVPGGPRRYDGELEEHSHVTCLRCGRVADVALPGIEIDDGHAARESGYEIVDHEVSFTGLCSECAAKEARRGGGVRGGEDAAEGHAD